MSKKFAVSGVLFIILAVASGAAEAVFYGGIDENGVLQESFFLPLTFLLAAAGLGAFAIAGLLHTLKRSA